MGINTTGAVTSGVTTYPAVIQLDDTNADILPNMSATANIITKVDDNVLLVPSAAVQTVGTTSTVRVLEKWSNFNGFGSNRRYFRFTNRNYLRTFRRRNGCDQCSFYRNNNFNVPERLHLAAD